MFNLRPSNKLYIEWPFFNQPDEPNIKPPLPQPNLNIKIKERKLRLICEELALVQELIMIHWVAYIFFVFLAAFWRGFTLESQARAPGH